MGRITIFTSRDLNSQRVKTALDKRELPYVEISVWKYPSRLSDLASLTGGNFAVPQTFVNNRCIGGVRETLKELRQWDKDERYACAAEKYLMEIKSRPGPQNDDPRLLLVEEPQPPLSNGGEQLHDHKFKKIEDDSYSTFLPETLRPPVCIPLLDGTCMTYYGVMEKLKRSLTLSDLVYHGTLYQKCFTGETAAKSIQRAFELANAEDALMFADSLVDLQLIQSLSGEKDMKASDKSLYRLQCDMTPGVLNSYRIHSPDSNSKSSRVPYSSSPSSVELTPVQIVNGLDALLTTLELESLNSRGKVDYVQLMLHENYPVFEEAVCALQLVDLSSKLHSSTNATTADNTAATVSAATTTDNDNNNNNNNEEDEQLAFALNLYKLFMRYAFVKVGFFETEEDRLHFLRKVQFQVGSMMFSFQQWVTWILRAHDTAMTSCVIRNALNERITMDWRIHCAIHCDALFGSSISLPFRTFSPENVEAELEIAAQAFLRDKYVVSIDPTTNAIKLSRIFKWYKNDFGPNSKTVLAKISKYLPDPSSVESITKLKFVDVKWTANATNYARFSPEVVVGQVTSSVGQMILGGLKRPLLAAAGITTTPSLSDSGKFRASTLQSLGLLDAPSVSDERINRITSMIQQEINVPLVFVNLADSTRQWCSTSVQWECHPVPQHQPSSSCSPETTKTPRLRDSFGGHTILSPSGEHDILYVENALEDDRMDAFVTGELGVRFYVGVPLLFPNGFGTNECIGTLCVVDVKPRRLTMKEMDRLREYAVLVKQEILRLDDSSDDLSECSTETVESVTTSACTG